MRSSLRVLGAVLTDSTDNMVWTCLVDDPEMPLTNELLADDTKAGHIQIIGLRALEEALYGIPSCDQGTVQSLQRDLSP